jgi:hypothetical protein
MMPRHFRAKAGVSLDVLADRLRMQPHDVRALEDTNIVLWEVNTLREYMAALGYQLRIVVGEEDVS